MQIAYQFWNVNTPPPLEAYCRLSCGRDEVHFYFQGKKSIETSVLLWWGSLETPVHACFAMFYYCMFRKANCWRSTKTLCISPFIWAEEVAASLMPLPSLCVFMAQVLFCFNEENWDAWMDAISGSGLQCVQMRRLSWENAKGLRHLLSGGRGYFEEPIVNVSYGRKMQQCQVMANIQGLSLISYFLLTIVRYWIFFQVSFKFLQSRWNSSKFLYIYESMQKSSFSPEVDLISFYLFIELY